MTYPKVINQKLSLHFETREFNCPCKACAETLIDPDLVLKLEALREELGVPLEITSGYRCQAHQDELGRQGYETAKGVSQHTLGRAADIKTGKHTGEELEKAARTVGFRAVGVAKCWAHLDLRSDRDRRWTYRS